VTYLRKPSTYVIAAVAIVAYMWVWPMVSRVFARGGSGDGPQN
jgi:hypothetical protein